MIMVDEWRVWGGRRRSCHLTADGENLEPLHRLAERIGLERAWFQPSAHHPHYDIMTFAGRARALKLGVTFVPAKAQAVARLFKRRTL